MNVLVKNPGGNSLKVEVVSGAPAQQFAFEGKNLVSLILECIGQAPCLSVEESRSCGPNGMEVASFDAFPA